ncbi:MAG: hypothetical protein JJE55_11560 [Flavobacteriaceae bacterium]|nr:hypothetical protein [Flavobacteriaceae bacterium]
MRFKVIYSFFGVVLDFGSKSKNKRRFDKIIPSIILLSLFSFSGFAQNYQSIEEVNKACTQLGFSGDEEAEIAVDNILAQLGLFRNFTIQECPEINNAVAKNIDVGSGQKERFILYDKEFFTRIEDKAANDWAAISVLAHEIGHHLNGHALNDQGSNHKWELEADEFSGFVLARMGSTLQDAQSAISTLKLEKATRTHPAKADRLKAIEKGWTRGSGKTVVATVILEEKKEEEKIEEEVEIIEEDITVNDIKESINVAEDDKKLLAQKILSNHIVAIGGEENIIKIKTLYNKIEAVNSLKVSGKDINYESDMEIIYLSPNKFVNEFDLNGTTHYNLNLEGKSYIRTSKKEAWKFQSYNEIMKNQSSYVTEYGLLVNNEDVRYSGIENFEGVSCYAIMLPERNSDQEQDLFSMKMNIKSVNYYNIETGLLVGTKSDSHTITHYKENSEYLKDTDVHTESLNIFSDYKRFNGVLFPTKFTMIIDSELSKIKVVMNYIEIKVNPEINPNDFRVTN